MSIWQSIEQQISHKLGKTFKVDEVRSVGGGCINEAMLVEGKLDDGHARFFVKTNKPGQLAMFAAEAQALKIMLATQTIRVPTPICFGEDDNKSYIVMEALEFASNLAQGQPSQILLAQHLAAMHEVVAAQFGWSLDNAPMDNTPMDNTIGSTPQLNAPMDDWLAFWQKNRLGFQLALAADNGYGGELQSLGERVMADMSVLFANRQVLPSMLHGDLWGGNVSALGDGTPVIFDPAFYYGDYEAELAMTALFGGFSADFYAAYRECRPREMGCELRQTLYNSYHIINHLNMFGGGYHAQAVQMLRQVVAEL